MALAKTPVSSLTQAEVTRIRSEFPILKERPHGKPLVFLDSAASSQKPIQVIDAMDDYYRRYHANIHRGVYHISELATEAYEEARRKTAFFIGASSADECIYVRNATEGINLVAYSWGRTNIKGGDAIVVTQMEHHSNLVPWQILAQQTGAELRFVRVTDDGLLDQPGVGVDDDRRRQRQAADRGRGRCPAIHPAHGRSPGPAG